MGLCKNLVHCASDNDIFSTLVCQVHDFGFSGLKHNTFLSSKSTVETARSLPISKLRPLYLIITSSLYATQICIWIHLQVSLNPIAKETAEHFLASDVCLTKTSYTNTYSQKLHVISYTYCSFNFPKLHAKFVHLGQGHYFENDVMGIHMRCNKYTQYEESRETAAHFDVQMDLSEIHVPPLRMFSSIIQISTQIILFPFVRFLGPLFPLLGDGNNSILEIFKLAFVGSVDVPPQIIQTVRAEIDVKLSGTQCNLVISRLKPLLLLHFSKRKNMILHDKIPHKERVQTSRLKTMTWTCTLSAPEATIVLYGNNDSPLYDVLLEFA